MHFQKKPGELQFLFLRKLVSAVRSNLNMQSIVSAGQTYPNPTVSCVIVCRSLQSPDHWWLFSGATETPGSKHAEIVAFDLYDSWCSSAQSHEIIAVYVTLEPCNTYGRTPPCSARLLQYKIRRLRTLHEDPSIKGSSLKQLSAAGIRLSHLFMQEPVVSGFISRLTRSRPILHLKVAHNQSRLIGCTEERLMISGMSALGFGNLLRSRCDAVLIGARTLLTDKPSLSVRPEQCSAFYTNDCCSKSDQSFAGRIIRYKDTIIEQLNHRQVEPARIIWTDRPDAALVKAASLLPGPASVMIAVILKPDATNAMVPDGEWVADFLDTKRNSILYCNTEEELLHHLAQIGINHLLIETGAQSANRFSRVAKDGDFLYRLISRNDSYSGIQNGIFVDEIWLAAEKVAAYELGEDTLEVYRYSS